MARIRKFNLILIFLTICLSGYLFINYIAFKNASSLSQIDIFLKNSNNEIFPNQPIDPQHKKYLENENNLKTIDLAPTIKRLMAYDGGGFGSVNSGLVKCHMDILSEVEVTRDRNNANLVYFNMGLPSGYLNKVGSKQRQYAMVYGMESEIHSYGGETWKNADFRMYYHLDKSFPEPATYFDVRMHLADLLSPVRVDFDNKENSAPIVWVVSNCNAHNGRQKFMKDLMTKIDVHSYGGCLKNKDNHFDQHMKGNIELYSKYKFVIAIENSNCEDYVTEKLVHAVASGSIPIVAGKDNKPDYRRFLPNNSYINIYDYKTVDELAAHIKKIASDPVEYHKYMPFKSNHLLTRKDLYNLNLKELIETSKQIISPNEIFFKELVAKEKSDNKLCKIASYLRRTPQDEVERQINERKAERDSREVACLISNNLPKYFDLK